MSSYSWISELVLWFEQNKRDFYWRKVELNDFQWIMLEILLRRSKAEKVNNISASFFNKYKKPSDILKVSCEELALDLRSLGYQNKRVDILKDVANDIATKFNGEVPRSLEDLCSIKHIGQYIASAFLCFRYNELEACVDTNVIRILGRFYGINVYGDNRIDLIINAVLKELLSHTNNKTFTYALLDLGGVVCLPRNPKCDVCPIYNNCYWALCNK